VPATSRISRNLGEVFSTQGPAVYRRALRLLGNHADAEEATQEVFIRALRGEDAFRGDSQVTTWLYRITTHYCLNQIRDRQRRRQLFQERMVHDSDQPTTPASPSDLVLLRRLLSEADKEQAQVAIYVYLDGMTHEEVAEVLGVSRRTVGNLLTRFEKWAQQHTGSPS
jgi:RNA polymerase sigma-70 factor (ECF subfamily)